MDLQFVRTFQAVVDSGSFVRAAALLNVTQSTVSMRIKALEAGLGQRLFLRGRKGVELTAAGRRFQRHAGTLLRVWRQARQEVALPPGFHAVLAVGSQHSLWDGLLLRWLARLPAAVPGLGLRAESGQPDALIHAVAEGALDLCVLYTPQSRPGLRVELLFEEHLVLVCSEPCDDAVARPDYVLVDWGAEFRAAHSRAHPDREPPALALGLGSLALDVILEQGGAGYLPERLVRPHLGRRLVTVAGAPSFHLPAHLVHAASRREAWFLQALATLRATVAETLAD